MSNNLLSKEWRLNHLYRIITKKGESIPFRLNPVQADVLAHMHTRNLILKARQLGMSTFAVLDMVDDALFTENLCTGIISYSLDHAQHIFQKIIGHALDTFPKDLRPMIGITQRSARKIHFNNGSSISVDTTLRGGSYQRILVSEFGKVCARNPIKAEEVITGSLQSISQDGIVIIESTGEGTEGYFADMVMEANRRGNDNLTPLDFKLFFYNWCQDPSYALSDKVKYDTSMTDYFSSLEKQGISLSIEQKYWYAKQFELLKDKIRQEYPTTISEAFLASTDAFYFAEAIEAAYKDNRCLTSSLFDSLLPVHVAMDIGVNDLTVMVFFQMAHGEIRIIDYYEDKNKDVDFYAKFLLQDKKYLISTIFLPHDSTKRDPLDVTNTYERDFKRLFAGTATRFIVLPRMDKQLSISHARNMLGRCVFNIGKVKPLLDQMAKYRKKWNEALGRYMEEPLHTIASNFADAFQYTMQGAKHLEATHSLGGALEKHRSVVENRSKRLY